ncbi:AtpZ/AtpI family protein [Epilithonimonas pallida]|uniref:F0F1-ATPase subunit Ca2+/Mg2+ transporter n=1 Tax=Epilithonimonas pallida TaxID=373671 RepID=A0ABY1R3I9_9FLAO|nr:AtpZ/AtpI family protein [Epilithonimonas pallida]SMP94246.1 Putative F0F1-ATPase subunit Ca2+/Mg2+ transporter [Epilithonimonas pallida]
MEDKKNNASDSLRKYGKYSSVVFQMLFIIGIAFWGGHQLDLYFETGSNVLVLVIGLGGLCLSLYTTLKRLEILNKEEQDNAKQK